MSKECKEWFKVSEIAELLGFSKVSIYNKIKTLNSETLQCLQTLQKKEKGITYYKFEAVEIIKAAFSQEYIIKEEIAPDVDEDEVQEALEENIDYEVEYIQELKSQIDFLKEQLKTKDDLILKHVKLIENEQIIRREEQKTYALMDEEKSKQVDEKLQAWRNSHFEESEKEGFFKKLFRKKM